ncbi:hypothetical protein E3N88_25472 [Mikania micrantha]|uniref:Retrotransposon gag domain-containing protein n=1 Tax=Mikania micrantha TaxID=192012 RepID=A0A5N6N518_9ASTR|nr:hypothetical protein E3N88_25472 [Mikania micrantha]
MAKYKAAETNDGKKPQNKEETIDKRKECNYKMFKSCDPANFTGNEGASGAIKWLQEMEAVLDISDCKDENKVRFASHSLKDEALFWWKMVLETKGRDATNRMTWEELKSLIMEKYCPINEVERMEVEFSTLEMVGFEHLAYTNKYIELGQLVPHLVTPESKRIGRYIWGLIPQIRGIVRSARPATFQSTIELSGILTDEARRVAEQQGSSSIGGKRKWSSYHPTGKTDERNVKRFDGNTKKVGDKQASNTSNYKGNAPWCNHCKRDHYGKCTVIECNKSSNLLETAAPHISSVEQRSRQRNTEKGYNPN